MKPNTSLVLISMLFLPISTTSCGSSDAQQPARGQIAFYSVRNGRADVYVMNADGSDVRLLTNGAVGGKCPAFSPNGTMIAFQRGGGPDEDIYVMNADGTDVRLLTDSRANERHAAWSPDGRQIAFQSDRDGNREIYVMNADGSEWRRLTHNPAHEMWPSWSPDGQRIAFNSLRDGNWEIYVINADGTGERRITNSALWELFPAWSPDGTRIAFRSGRAEVFEGDIHTMAPDGTDEREVTHAEGMEEDPVWSPDGRQIAFQAMRDGNFDIYVIDREGGEWTNLTRHPAHDYWPKWAPRPGAAPAMMQGTSQAGGVEIQVVYDAVASGEDLVAGAGFSALVKVDNHVLLFDTGADGRILLSNMARLGIDPAAIDQIVISHSHSDHLGGLPTLIERCEKPELYVTASLPNNLTGRAVTLVAEAIERGRQRAAGVIEVGEPVRVAEHVFTTGQLGTRIPEQALIVRTARGLIVVTGCAHPGVVEITRRAMELHQQEVLLVMGGFHLAGTNRAETESVVSELSELTTYVAPCHCSGDGAQELFRRAFGDRHVECGVGTIVNSEEL